MIDNNKINKDNVNSVIDFIKNSKWSDDFNNHLKVEYNTDLDSLKSSELSDVTYTLNNANLFFLEHFSVMDLVNSIDEYMTVYNRQNHFGLYWFLEDLQNSLYQYYRHNVKIFDNNSLIKIIRCLNSKIFSGIADDVCGEYGYVLTELEETDTTTLYAMLSEIIDSIQDIFERKIVINLYDLNNIYLDV